MAIEISVGFDYGDRVTVDGRGDFSVCGVVIDQTMQPSLMLRAVDNSGAHTFYAFLPDCEKIAQRPAEVLS